MTSPPSGSEPRTSAAFESFHPGVQRWIWDKSWPHLRDIQEQAAPVVASGRDVIITAATASGKTEAAWLPVCSQLAFDRDNGAAETGVSALYIAPLKALINDQHSRLDDLCERLSIPVHRWHGDVAGSRKKALLSKPDGLLLITPESLEALFVNRGHEIPALFHGLRHVVIDEVHSFIGDERGAQLQSLLTRLELALKRRVPRIALSATLGDNRDPARQFLRPGHLHDVVVLEAPPGGDELKMQVRGYLDAIPDRPGPTAMVEGKEDEESSSALTGIADHLFKVLRGQDNLVFANSRRNVERLTDQLSRRSTEARLPNEFLAHHGSLSRDLREDAETRLKDPARATTAICTSTLEMGIDIGSVDSIAQIGAPPSVASLRQRLGRSGRRPGQAAVLRAYITERDIDARTPLTDEIRSELFQCVAMTELLLRGWYETGADGALHLSTLIQQILSMLAQHGEVVPADLFRVLCQNGPFTKVNRSTFTRLLRSIGAHELIQQERTGGLSLGSAGEKLVNHYSFYAAFSSSEEYRLVGDGRPIGTLPVDRPLSEGTLMIFAGRRWRILSIDTSAKVLELARARGGRAPSFFGDGPSVADEVRHEMLKLYLSDDVPAYLDAPAQTLLDQGRAAFRRRDLARNPIQRNGKHTLLFCWQGDAVLDTLAAAVTQAGLRATVDGVAIAVEADPDTTWHQLRQLAPTPQPDPVELASTVIVKERDKHDRYLDEDLLNTSYAAAVFNPTGAWAALAALAASPAPTEGAAGTLGDDWDDIPDAASDAELRKSGFAVIDVETTGFAAYRRDRIVEIAAVLVDPDGTVTSTWTTVLNPGRDPGPTRIHHLTAVDTASAPRFADIAGDLAQQLSRRVIVAHNALFDLTFLYAEYARAGIEMPAWPALCTMEAAYALRPDGGRSLADCCAAEDVPLAGAHTALGDATATAVLLGRYLAEADKTGRTLADLSCRPATAPPRWAPVPPSGRTSARSTQPIRENTSAGWSARARVARTGNAADGAYLDLLDRALADLVLTDVEVSGLSEVAVAFGLTPARLSQLHHAYILALAPVVGAERADAMARRLDHVTA